MTVRVNLNYVLIALLALMALIVVGQLPELKRYIKIEQM